VKTNASSENYSIGEEIAHAVTHGTGIPLSIAALAVLVAFSALYGDAWHIFVLAGSILHFFSILFYVVPGAPPA
jgi:predicted membrane channel-forming protein YqfA (hemolysin III family)